MGKTFILIGVVFLLVGLVLTFVPVGLLGRLPGDIVWRAKGWTLFIPVTTSVLISLLLTLLFRLISHFRP